MPRLCLAIEKLEEKIYESLFNLTNENSQLKEKLKSNKKKLDYSFELIQTLKAHLNEEQKLNEQLCMLKFSF